MASNSMAILMLAMTLAAVVFVSPAESQTCKSRKFSGRTFSNCSNLPVLSSELHWTYHEANGSLAVSFTATPPSSSGWVAWGINPTGTGMTGTQAFVAAKMANGSVSVKTYNISSYSSIVPSELLSFDVLEKSAESSGGKITIFAVVKVPTGKAEALNHIWQVGPGFNSTNGWLLKHEFKPENLAAKGTLNLVTGSASLPETSPTAPAASQKKNGVVSVTASFGNLALCALISLLVLVTL